MGKCRTWLSRQQWLTGLLISSILVVLLLPAHLHLHHLGDADDVYGHHEHKVDLHFLTDIGTHADPDSSSTPLKNDPGGLVKKFSDYSLDVVLLLVLLVLLPVSGFKVTWRSCQQSYQRLRYYSLVPPLRAPPQH